MIRVLHVCSEVYPLLKTGGLADVAGSLPPALARHDGDVRILVPGFPAITDGLPSPRLVAEVPARFGASAVRLYLADFPDTAGIKIYFIDAPGLYDRPGNPYSDALGKDYADNHRRFALLGWMAAQLAQGIDPSWGPQVVHGHDWHAGLAPAYLRAAEHRLGRKLAGTVFTIHNLAYQGVFAPYAFGELDLPDYFFNMHGLEFHGQISFMKAGLFYSDKLTTVSPTYAREIQGAEQGCGLQGLLNTRSADLHGILNGVDPLVWNPATDPAIASNYDAKSLERKLICKRVLQEECGLNVQNDAPLFTVVSRITEQKGLNLVQAGLHDIVQRGGQLVLLGAGDAAMEETFKKAAQAHPHSVSVHIGYDERRSHRLIAGGDVILVPSRFEPCGLTQLYGLAYGTLPLVRRVGGLADSVVDCTLENIAEGTATGFVFDHFDSQSFNTAVRRAFALYDRKDDWLRVQQAGMRQEFNWDVAAKAFMSLYRQVAA
ncbi:glycogen synthase GlgA [Oxalobacteraceae bacterium R-40]|uniref:Glycogen synthase n=1 Tax=Keguizhuia sedimenti TaxID=3064264 RepID=A0ABU1BP12_9BURK|nr:glycogen synthase GlgA [Oxalobacteraceae bacterium R-40]